jgi:hypothetical protein
MSAGDRGRPVDADRKLVINLKTSKAFGLTVSACSRKWLRRDPREGNIRLELYRLMV